MRMYPRFVLNDAVLSIATELQRVDLGWVRFLITQGEMLVYEYTLSWVPQDQYLPIPPNIEEIKRFSMGDAINRLYEIRLFMRDPRDITGDPRAPAYINGRDQPAIFEQFLSRTENKAVVQALEAYERYLDAYTASTKDSGE